MPSKVSFLGGMVVGVAASGVLFYAFYDILRPRVGNGSNSRKVGSNNTHTTTTTTTIVRKGNSITSEKSTGGENKRYSEPVPLTSPSPHTKVSPSALSCTRMRSIQLSYTSVGVIESCFPSCRGTPRQGFLMPSARATLWLHNDISADTIDGLSGFSHIWVIFHFHRNKASHRQTGSQSTKNLKRISAKQAAGIAKRQRPRFKAKINPPKLPSGIKVGVFSARTPHRPNAVGLTMCRLEKVDVKNRCLFISGVDLVEGTPVIDIKPYVPHYDSLPTAEVAEWVQNSLAAPMLEVIIEPNARAIMAKEVALLVAAEQAAVHNPINIRSSRKSQKNEGKQTDNSWRSSQHAEPIMPTALRVYNSVDSLERAVTEMLRLDINSGGTSNKVKRGKFGKGNNIGGNGSTAEDPVRVFFTVLDGLKFECHWRQHESGSVRVVNVSRAEAT